MDTLFGFPFSCSLAVKWVLRQHALPFESRVVQRGPARQIQDAALAELNPKRRVPVLVRGGEVWTEIISILHRLDGEGAQRSATLRHRHLEWLCYLGTELHQAVLGPLFDPAAPQGARSDARERLLPVALAHLDRSLGARPTLLADPVPSAADAYLLWATTLLHSAGLVGEHPGLRAHSRFMRSQPWVGPVLVEERAAWAGAVRA